MDGRLSVGTASEDRVEGRAILGWVLVLVMPSLFAALLTVTVLPTPLNGARINGPGTTPDDCRSAPRGISS